MVGGQAGVTPQYAAAIMFFGGLMIPKGCSRWHNIQTDIMTNRLNGPRGRSSENPAYSSSSLDETQREQSRQISAFEG